MNVVLRLPELMLSLCGGGVVGWGGVCTVIFVSNPTTELRLCCVVVGVVTTTFSGWVAGEMENQAIASSNLKLKWKLSLAKIQVDSCFVMLCCVDVVEL